MSDNARTDHPPWDEGTEERTYIGRIESVERHNDRPNSWYTIILDAADARMDPWDLVEGKPTRSNLAVIRVVTTAAKFARMAGLATPNDEDGNENLAGRWVELDLVPPRLMSGPRAQVCVLGEGGYERVEVFAVADIVDFGFLPEEGPRPDRAGLRASYQAAELSFLGRIDFGVTRPDPHSAHQLLGLSAQTIGTIVVHDVGHANFTTLLNTEGDPVLHFDAGWPIGFNWKTYPPTPPKIPFAKFVVLSHWDWDHLHGFHKWNEVRNAQWIVPDQDLGPNALFVKLQLGRHGRLTVLPHQPGKRHVSGGIEIIGADPSHVTGKSKKRNNSGISMIVKLASKERVLLPGDADYVATGVGLAPDLLVASHHGAEFAGAMPVAVSSNPRAIVSMGIGNCYQHPSASSLTAHSISGWRLEFTSSTPEIGLTPFPPRGDRTLP